MPRQATPALTDRASLRRELDEAAFVLSLRDRVPDAASTSDAPARLGLSPEGASLAFARPVDGC